MTALMNLAQSPRLISIDDNIRNVGGHFYELATLLCGGAEALGYRPVLATHRSFHQPTLKPASWTIIPTFQTRRMVRWSLGVDGQSSGPRDFNGNPTSDRRMQNFRISFSDWLSPPAKRPTQMLRQWSNDFCELMEQLKPSSSDSLLINTGDDFVMLALVNAIHRLQLPPMRIDVIFHFALIEEQDDRRRERLKMIGRQLEKASNELKAHSLHFHATTDSLAAQLRETDSGLHIHSIPYPTRPRAIAVPSLESPIKAVLAGLPRAEKGREAICGLIDDIESTLLKPGRVRLSMQMPADKWQSMIPKSHHGRFQKALTDSSEGTSTSGPFEVMTSNLSTDDYHRWLDSADLGLFLYDADRYVARCSGVLLEMMARGVPVIVPDRSWLADQVRLAGGHRSIGFIYQHRSEIPELIRQFLKHRKTIQTRSIGHAKVIMSRHSGENTLRAMGLNQQIRQSAA